MLCEAKLEEKGLKSRIHRKGHRGKPLSEREKRGNKTRSKVRARVEHVFGAQSNDMGGTLVRGIGRARIGLKTSSTTCADWCSWKRLSRRVCRDNDARGVCLKLTLTAK